MKKIGLKIISVLMVFLVAAIVSPAMVTADNFGFTVPVQVNNLRINGHDISADATEASIFFRNKDMSVSFDVKALADLEDVEIQVAITGFKSNQYDDERMSEVEFYKSIPLNKSMPVDMTLEIPDDIDTKDAKFRILVSTADSSMNPFNFNLALQAPDDQVEIRDIILNPTDEVQAGRSMTAKVRLKNNGAYDQEDIKITAEVAELDGVRSTYYMNTLDADDTETSEYLLLRIPVSAKPGVYTLDVEVEYADGHEEVRDSVDFRITESDVSTSTCATTNTCNTNTNTNTNTNNSNTNTNTGTNNNNNNGNTNTNTNTNTGTTDNGILINYDSNSKVLTQGEGGAIYSITIANQGNTAKSFVIDASGVDWATIKLSPGNLVVVNPGETKAVYVYASAKDDATVGAHEFTAVIKSGSTVVGTASFKADVVESAGALNKTAFNSVLTYLLIAFVIVLAIAVIVLAVTRNKGGNSRKQPEQQQQSSEYESAQSYY